MRGEESDGVVGEEGVEGDGEVAGAEEDERPVEREAPDCGGVVEVNAAGGGEEVVEVEGGPGWGLVAWRGVGGGGEETGCVSCEGDGRQGVYRVCTSLLFNWLHVASKG